MSAARATLGTSAVPPHPETLCGDTALEPGAAVGDAVVAGVVTGTAAEDAIGVPPAAAVQTAPEGAGGGGGRGRGRGLTAATKGRKRTRADAEAAALAVPAAAVNEQAVDREAPLRPQRRAKQAAAAVAVNAVWASGAAAPAVGGSGSRGRARKATCRPAQQGSSGGETGAGASANAPTNGDAAVVQNTTAAAEAAVLAGQAADGQAGAVANVPEAALAPAAGEAILTAGQGSPDARPARRRRAATGAAADAEAVAATRPRRKGKETGDTPGGVPLADGAQVLVTTSPATMRKGKKAAATGKKAPTGEETEGVPAASPPVGRKGKKVADPRFTVMSPEEAQALQGEPLLDLGELVVGKLLRRPSASIKTPYVADVMLMATNAPPLPDATALEGGPAATPAADSDAAAEAAGGGSSCGSAGATAAATEAADGRAGAAACISAAGSGPLVLAHAPAMDCAGMVTPGARLYMSNSAARREGAPRTATSHAIQLVEDQRPGGSVAVVGSHPQLAERLAAEVLRRRGLAAALGDYDGVDSQRTFGNTRVDYVLRMTDGSWTLLEVKNVVCADFPEGAVPAGRPAVGVYTTAVPPGTTYRPTALFPHGAAKPKIKVVSDRAIKHVWELTQLHSAGIDAATGTRLRCAVLFVVNRSDCAAFRPCHEADPLFAQVLRAAREAGMQLLAFDVDWRGGAAYLGKQLPVVFGECVTAQYDPARLREVLEFNATDPRKNWKKAAVGGKTGGGKAAAGGRKLEEAEGKEAAGGKEADAQEGEGKVAADGKPAAGRKAAGKRKAAR